MSQLLWRRAAPQAAASGFLEIRVMFTVFERALKPTSLPKQPEAPARLVAFYWHFAKQAKGLLVALFAAGFLVALLDSMVPVFVGRVVTLVTTNRPDQLLADFWPQLAGMALVMLVARPVAVTMQRSEEHT